MFKIFNHTRKYVVTRDLNAIVKKSSVNISIGCQIRMLDMVASMLLYDCDLRGFKNIYIIEKLHFKIS